MQILTIAGTIGRDAELRNTQGGDSVLNFSVAVSNGKDRDGNWRDSTWYDCSIWGKRATDAVRGILRKGGKVTVTGRPTVRVHEGKAYLGVSVNDFTLQGDGNSGGGSQGKSDPQDGYSYGGSGQSDMDDEIPF